jgi:hypothetical protein
VGDALIDALTLQASRGKPLSLKASQTVLGLGQTAAGDWEVLIRSGKALSTQAFDAQTGLAKGKVVTVKPGDVRFKETQYGLDLDGDGEVGGSEEQIPSDGKTLRAGSNLSKLLLQTVGVTHVTSGDVGLVTATPSYHQALVLGATGSPGATLNIDGGRVDGLKNPLVIGAVSTDRQSATGTGDDKILSANKLLGPGLYAGVGNNQLGIVNIKNAEIHFTGGQPSTYFLKEFGMEASEIEELPDNSFAFAVMAAGFDRAGVFKAESSGVINITDSSLYFYRNVDPGSLSLSNPTSSRPLLTFGSGNGRGTANILNSTLELKGLQNIVNIGELGGTGNVTLNSSQLLLAGQYSIYEKDAFLRGYYANVCIFVGEQGVGRLDILNKSNVRLNGLEAIVEVGKVAGRGMVNIDASRVQLIAERSTEPLLRNTNPLSWDEYGASWSDASLVIGGGYDDNDGSAKTNNLNSGSVDIANGSLFLVKGPHAGIEVGGSGTKSTGELSINSSVVEVVGSGAIQRPGSTGRFPQDYLSSSGDNGNYFTYVNIGGSGWNDFGGNGTINLSNGAELKIYEFDIVSGDTLLQASNANLSIGNWGNKASLHIDGGSKVSVAGSVRLGLGQDMAQTNFNTDAGLANVSNYSMANIASGRLDVYSYNSSVANQGLKSPLTNYAMYTVLGSQGTLTANQFGFYKNSQIIGSGRIVLDDVFSNSTVSLHSDTETSKTHVVKDAGSDGFMVIDETELLIGDGFNFDNLARRPGFGTLIMKDETGSEYRGSLTVEDSTLVFDISKGQSDKLVVEGFDYCSMNRNNFVVSGTGLQRGERYVLIDFKLNPEGFSGDLEQLLNLKLIGVKGELTYDAAAMDVVFTVQ